MYNFMVARGSRSHKFHEVQRGYASQIFFFWKGFYFVLFKPQVFLTGHWLLLPCCHLGSVFRGKSQDPSTFYLVYVPRLRCGFDDSRISLLSGVSGCGVCSNHFGDEWTDTIGHLLVAIPWESPSHDASPSSCTFFAADPCDWGDVDTLHGALKAWVLTDRFSWIFEKQIMRLSEIHPDFSQPWHLKLAIQMATSNQVVWAKPPIDLGSTAIPRCKKNCKLMEVVANPALHMRRDSCQVEFFDCRMMKVSNKAFQWINREFAALKSLVVIPGRSVFFSPVPLKTGSGDCISILSVFELVQAMQLCRHFSPHIFGSIVNPQAKLPLAFNTNVHLCHPPLAGEVATAGIWEKLSSRFVWQGGGQSLLSHSN